MNANGYLPERVMDSSTLSQKRRASLFRESDHDEDVDTHSSNGLARNPPGPTRLIKKPQPRLLYSEAMVLGAMRGELIYTPALKPLKDSIARNMRLTNQVVGRHLGSNIHYSKMKSILKQRQHEMITLERYLLSEAFIRTDIWNTIRLQEFFELVHSYGLERQFRDEYWEKNQSSHSANVQKLYDCVKRPLTHLALDDALADQIESWAKDIMSRSVFVPQADHPVIRSAVAIMNIAEQQPRDDLKVWDKLQEGPKRVAQIWTAWCLARNKDWVETTYLAAIILKRGSKSKMIAKCFRRENSALLKLVDNGYDKEACRHWQDMHGKCHVISMQELLSRPVVVNLVGASVASSTQQKTCLSTPSLQKTTHTAKKTGNDLFRVVPSKAKELASISQSQLAITRSPCIQQSSFVQRSSVVSSIERDHSPEDMAQELPILDSSHPKKDRNDERKQSKTINLEMDQPHVKKRKTVSFDLGSPRQAQSSVRCFPNVAPSPATFTAPANATNSVTSSPLIATSPSHNASLSSPDMAPTCRATMPAPPPTPTDPISQWMNQMVNPSDLTNMVAMRLFGGIPAFPFNGQPVVAKSEHETLEGTWTKLEAEVDKKLSPFLRQLDNLSRDVKALSEKHAVFEQTITRKVDDQHTAQGGEHTTFEKTAETKMDELTKLVGSQQTAFAQVVAKMDHRHTMISYEHGDFQQTITKKMDNLSQLIHTLQQDQDEIESRIDRGRKKRPKPTANDEVVDSITCAPLEKMAS
ncbi:hypothetical protein ColTof4_04630 [Colletotrichum tofieldiae]|uniref:Uncharacterized protein n=1 Tax=Colletotrichum tofieldiae TaxID=708197 RepID=A0A166NMI7_9PEZI|nr:hypothetical protein CT0861_10362 [Colletotrichum tofieldiae]GKT63789.1 hypothetical protein ColTof3_11128 [Colletotrichum tofieldiae]GKT72207.1 hypothetical protein ColTof4_04630 [Colletotrichum tofieldiae]